MNILMILIVVISIVVMIFGAIMLSAYGMLLKGLHRTYESMRRDLKSTLGYDENNWPSNFDDMKRDIRRSKEKIGEVYNLGVIQSAIKVRNLENLQKTKNDAEREIERLSK